MTKSKPMTPAALKGAQAKQTDNLNKLSEAGKALAEERRIEDLMDAQKENDAEIQALQDLEDEMRVKEEERIITEVAQPVGPSNFQYHVCVVARIKGDNIYSDALVNVPQTVESAENINALRNAMAQQLGALPERVTIVTFQYVTAVFA